MAGWADRLPDGTEVWYDPDTNTSTPLDPNRPGAQPIGGPAPNITGGGGGGGQTFQTREGPKTVAQMQAELRAAGGNPPSDPNAVLQMYQSIGGAAKTGAFDYDRLWAAMTDTQQQMFDWDKDKFNQTMAEQKRQFDEQQAMQGRGQYASLAQGLLSGAASLRGPQDWLKYAQYTTGGKNIFDRLYGNEAAPAFGAPSGYSKPATISDMLNELGLL